MTGTEKQQAWAEDIKALTLAQVETMRQQVAAHPTATDDQRAARTQELDAAVAIMELQTAAWWIDRAQDPAREVIREAYRMSR